MLALPATSLAEDREPIRAIEQLDLADLLDLEVDVATRSEQSAREVAGLVTVLTADDLRRAGCRDLADALRLLPSFEVGLDTWSAVGLAVRGNWAFESKVLVLIDGHDWSETDYGTFTLGNRLPASAIERIEVVRGPGSAVYGGYASLAVVKVTTRASGDIDGTRIDARTSWLDSGAYGRQDVGLSGGWALGDRSRLGVSAVLGRGRRSDDVYRDARGETADLTDASATDPALVSAELRVGEFTAAVMAEWYHTTRIDGYTYLQRQPHDSDQVGLYSRLSWRLPLGEHWELTPRAAFKWQQPWRSLRDRPPALQSLNRTDRSLAGIDLHGAPSRILDLLVGGEAGVDRGHVPEFQPDYFYGDGPDQSFLFAAGWAQGIVRTPIVVLTGGVRLDANDAYGEAVSPRLALTRAWEHAHAKLQLSRAFRAPGFQQSIYGVEPERSTTLEAEVGVEPVRWMYVVGSVFDVRMTDAIVYVVTGTDEAYTNVGRTGSRGGELSVDARLHPLSFGAGYAGWTGARIADPATDRFRVPGHPAAHLGLPNHKVMLRASVDLTRTASFGAVATVLGPRSAITRVDADGAPIYTHLPTAATIDLTAGWSAIARSPLGVTVVVHDLLDAAPPVAQPYDALHAPMPFAGRELLLQLTGEW